MIVLDLSILNQKGTPMFNSDTFANRPAFGIVGRIFISTDTKEFFRDTGTSWELIGGPGSGTITGSGTVGTLPIWTTSSALGDSTLIEGATLISTTKDIKADAFYLTGAAATNGVLYWISDRVTLANYNAGGIVHIEVNGGYTSTIFGTDLSLTNNGYISAVPTLTAANNASSVAIIGVNTLSYAASFSANNIGAIYGAITGFNLQTFAGNATFANANVASGGSSVNSIDFSSGGSTITMTQSSGIRVMSGQQNLFQYQGTNSGTITHAAISQNTGFYRPTAATGILTITNAYSHLINALDDYGAGFTFTNRWGIYQAGASDLNYFAANMLVGSTTNNGSKLQITGAATISSSITAASIIKSGGTSSQYLMADGSTSTLTNPVTGTGTTNYLPKFTAASTIGNSAIFDDSGKIGIGTATPDASFKCTISGNSATVSPGIYFNDEASSPTNYAFYTNGSKNFVLRNQSTSNNIAVFTPTGNLGLSVTPSAWRSTNPAFQIGQSTSLFSYSSSNIGGLASNAFINSSGNEIYIANGFASLYQFGNNGQHSWLIAPSGTAGNAISFTQAMTLLNNGNLLVGTTTDGGAKLQVNGTAYIGGITNIGATAGGAHQLNVNVNGGADREMFICGVLSVSNGFRVRFDNATTTVRVSMSSLPTSPVGLSSGDIWNNVGILNIV